MADSAAAVTTAMQDLSMQEQEAKFPLADVPEQQSADVNGETYAYYTYNANASSDPAQLVLLHGNQSSSRCWRELMGHPKLSKTKAVAVDVRGFGKTTYNNDAQSHDDLAKDLALLLTQLKLKDCTLICWSTAGAWGANLAASNPELVSKLVLLSAIGPTGFHMTKEGKDPSDRVPCANKDDIGMELRFFLQAYAGNSWAPIIGFWDKIVWDKSFVSEARRKEFGEDALQQRNLVDIAWLNHTYDAVKSGVAGKIKAKVLILHGSNDLVLKVDKTAQEWAKLLPGATLKIIAGGTHALTLGKRDETCNAIVDFLA